MRRPHEGHTAFRIGRSAAGARALALVALILAASSGTAWPQTYQGSLRGQISDSQGVVVGAEIALVNEETNATRHVVSNEVGEYAFAGLLPGPYTIRVSRAGFTSAARPGVRVGTQSSLVQDFVLEVGAVLQQVTVSAASQTDRADAAIANVLRAQQIASLPLFGRNTFYAAIFTPGVIQSGDPQFVRYQDQTNASMLSLGGGPRRGSAYIVEGVSITDFLNRATWFPSTEAIEDVRVQIRSYETDMGRAAGGMFNVTARSGANQWHGSALLLAKPGWATGQLFFAKRAGSPNPPQRYYNWAGSAGGPIVRDRTFVWFSTDEYTQRSTRNNVLTLPTTRERAGDFSQSFNSQGQLIVIYDPLSTRPDPDRPGQYIRDPFSGNVIPTNRINSIARAMLAYMPVPTSGRAFNAQAVLDDGPQDQETLKIDHRWSESWTTSSTYGRQRTKEPGSAFWGAHGEVPGDPGSSILQRGVHFAALNNVFIPNDSTVIAARYGYNWFRDNANNFPPFDARTLGFSNAYVSALTFNTFPLVSLSGYASLGNTAPDITDHISQTANVNVSKFVRNHSLKLGVDYRRIEARTTTYGAAAGFFTFNEGFTQGPSPNTAGTVSGDTVASFLLGHPAAGMIQVATPARYFINYYSGYLQDDLRINPRFTLNAGLRYEYEPGIAARDNRLTVGFDRDARFPVRVPGLDLKGGLAYAGVDGHPTRQGRTLNAIAPRGGFAWSPDRTVVRGGYGWFWAPTQVPGLAEAAIGARGYSAATILLASSDGGLTPAVSLSNPFPGGITRPQGNALGLATGAGGSIDFVDQEAKRAYIQQYSLDVQRDVGANNVIGVSYLGSRSERLSVGGTADAVVNINQLDPQLFALGTALQEQVANPFYGIAAFGSLSSTPTIARGQLLRPFPEFDNVLAHRVNEARSRYNALVMRWNTRMRDGYAVDANYTLSRLEDNQFGESNNFSGRLGNALNGRDLAGEYGVSLLDVTHRLNFSATFELPVGSSRRWFSGSGAAAALLNGWSVTAAARYQTGFPLNIWQSSNNSGLFGSTQRPNLTPGIDVMTIGSQEERAVSGWINPAAFTAAPPFTFGSVPRTNPDWRGPGQRTVDVAIQKRTRLGNKELSARADILNVFDDPLFFGPVTAFGVSNFGRITAVGGFARSMQFHLRLTF